MDTQELDGKIKRLSDHAQEWATLDINEKIAMGDRLIERTLEVGKRQVRAAIEAKQIPPGSPAVGEEWLGGPLITMRTVRLTMNSLREIAAKGTPQLKPDAIRQREDGRVVVDVFPTDRWDALLYQGFEAEIWMQDDVTPKNLADTMGVFYKEQSPEGKVALVLGAGNVASIGPLDVVYKLFAEGQVCMLKMNPVNDYLGEFIEESFREFIDRGFLEMAYGGADVGAYLCQHDSVDEIHITGSDKTHDAIVYGVGEEGAERKAKDERLNDKRITSELGNVSPVIIVPGEWAPSDLTFHAENISTQLANNGAFNCNATRVVITHAQWPQREAFLDALRDAYRRVPQRVPYYPGARDRYARWVSQATQPVEEYGVTNEKLLPWALVPNLSSDDKENILFREESFCSIQAETSLDADSVGDFLRQAVDFANDTCWGTLNCSIFIDPKTAQAHSGQLEQALTDLRFGSIVINHWAALAYGLGVTTWGAHPGHTYQDIQSGIGVVHNSLLFDKPLKTVIRGPFKMFPKPPWFATNKNTHEIAPRLCEFELNPNVKNLGRILWYAVRG